MQVVQPKATTSKPNADSGESRPTRPRWSVTARDPGASDVLMLGATVSPIRARSPAATITDGSDVLGHEVTAAIRTLP